MGRIEVACFSGRVEWSGARAVWGSVREGRSHRSLDDQREIVAMSCKKGDRMLT